MLCLPIGKRVPIEKQKQQENKRETVRLLMYRVVIQTIINTKQSSKKLNKLLEKPEGMSHSLVMCNPLELKMTKVLGVLNLLDQL